MSRRKSPNGKIPTPEFAIRSEDGVALRVAIRAENPESRPPIDPTTGRGDAENALALAALCGMTRACSILAAIVDPNGADSAGRTPLSLAAEWGSLPVCLALLEAGADPSVPGRGGLLPEDLARDPVTRDALRAARESRTMEAEVANPTDGRERRRRI